jgi:hypothetical protein
MAGIHQFSERVIDYAERLDAMADAAKGKRRMSGKLTRWMALPASGAAIYALVRSESFSRQAKDVLGGAKSAAADLPDDLLKAVRQSAGTVTNTVSGSDGAAGRRSSAARSSARRRTTARKRSSTRKATSSSR